MEYVHAEPAQTESANIITSAADTSQNPKIRKSLEHFPELAARVLSVYLTPSNTGGVNLCPHASPGCVDACISDSQKQGFGRIFGTVFQSRWERTQRYRKDRKRFLQDMTEELRRQQRLASRRGETVFIRDNMGSDIDWHRLSEIHEIDYFGDLGVHPELARVIHYNYTKDLKRLLRRRPANDYLCFSRSETNHQQCLEALEAGHNVAVVFSQGPEFYGSQRQYLTVLPDSWKPEGAAQSYPVIDGDAHDFRHLDPSGPCIVGLRMKGDRLQVAAAIQSGFAVLTEGRG
jgi:hypothetical protein